jgi:predicted oxidoreductase
VEARAYQADAVIAGGGLAGLVTALELLDHGRRVLVLDKDVEAAAGGLARESFGGIHLIGTPQQRRMGIRDSPELAWRDWQACARFEAQDEWPRRWARLYCDAAHDQIYRFLHELGIRFLPIVNWPERGLFQAFNSVPRWHVAWGTGHEIAERVRAALARHPRAARLTLLFEHEVSAVETSAGRASAFAGRELRSGAGFVARGEHLVIATGGMCGGDLSKLRAHWYRPWGEPPRVLLNGAHRFGDGLLQDRVGELGGSVTHLDLQWHYAAGIHHPARRRPDDGLSLVPPRSALWMNALGQRIGPVPLMGYTDTRYLVERICQEPGAYSWLVLNRRIAMKELAVSGCDYMTAFRMKKRLRLVTDLLFGNRELVSRLVAECPEDVVTAGSLPELAERMQERSLFGLGIERAALEAAVREYDGQIERGPAYFNDDQLRRLAAFRAYRGDRVRLCRFQRILDPAAGPLMALRCFILARKSLGGIQTDLSGRVLKTDGSPLPGLYAVGEAAGFGGGGIHGTGSLEGTFLGACVLTGRAAGRAIAGA